jgi:hypothetical protein
MKHKKLKTELIRVLGTATDKGSTRALLEVLLLNQTEMELTVGGASPQCPALNKKNCNSFGVGNCDINFKLRRKKKPKS